jgi:hypothetical protein
MNRTALLASTALFVLATPAFADGQGHKMTGLGEVGYDYTDIDDFNVDRNTFHGQGSVHWRLDGNWNVQGNFGFNSDRFDTGGGPSPTVDTWKIGGTAFWRNQGDGAIGGELYYQSVDIFGFSADGFGIAGRGELYLSPTMTLGARVGYGTVDEAGLDLDEWSLGAMGRYYAQPNLGLSLGLNYVSFDDDGGEGFDEWNLRGEAEYLFAECDTSIYGSLMFGDFDADSGGDSSEWGLGLGVRLYFGTSGSLAQRQRSGPLEEWRTTRLAF